MNEDIDAIIWVPGASDLPQDVQERIAAALPAMAATGRIETPDRSQGSSQGYVLLLEALLTRLCIELPSESVVDSIQS